MRHIGKSVFQSVLKKKEPAKTEAHGGRDDFGFRRYSCLGGLSPRTSSGGKDARGNRNTLSLFRP